MLEQRIWLKNKMKSKQFTLAMSFPLLFITYILPLKT